VLGNRMVKTFDDYVQALCVADHECNGQTKLSLHTVRIAIASRDKKTVYKTLEYQRKIIAHIICR